MFVGHQHSMLHVARHLHVVVVALSASATSTKQHGSCFGLCSPHREHAIVTAHYLPCIMRLGASSAGFPYPVMCTLHAKNVVRPGD